MSHLRTRSPVEITEAGLSTKYSLASPSANLFSFPPSQVLFLKALSSTLLTSKSL